MPTLVSGPLFRISAAAVMAAAFSSTAAAQIVINEVVKEQRSAFGGTSSPNTREFVELYNAGDTPIDLTNWTLGVITLGDGFAGPTDTIPSGTIAPGDYFVIGGSAVANVDYSPIDEDLWNDFEAHVMELRNPSGDLQDAIAYDVYRAGLGNATSEQLAEIGTGYWASANSPTPNNSAINDTTLQISFSRYQDGVDTNRTGVDFGMLPLTPGASNNTLPQSVAHNVPDVDAMSPGALLPDDYYSAFVLPRAINPTAVSGINPRSIPASPQGGNAIVVWDESGGGNAAYSKELVNSYDIYAYFDTAAPGVAAGTQDEEWEFVAYGIGTTDTLFDNTDPTGDIAFFDDPANSAAFIRNGSTGIGWFYQQYENFSDPSSDFSKLMLVDFGQSGSSQPDATDGWNVITTIDMTEFDSDWYRLSVDYDPETGDVVAVFDDQTFNFTTGTDQYGTFYVGHREAFSSGVALSLMNPAIYDLVEPETGGLVGDYNSDGMVDAADYTVWRDNLGSSFSLPNRDPASTGDVSQDDYIAWRDNFGASSGASAAGAAPEPAALLLSGLGLAAVATCRRVRR